MHAKIIILSLFAVACIAGCDDSPQTISSQPASVTQTYTNEELLRAVDEAQREADAATPPEPAIALPELEDWIRSELRSLPPDDHGFTVAYDHRDGLAVTLYQYTRGLRVIPEDLQSGPIPMEMQQAKTGIEQATQLGYWQSAKETDKGIVSLGDSEKKALWSRYALTVDGEILSSEIYVWSHQNTLFKIRCTGQSQNAEKEAKILSQLLTAIGNACSPGSD